MAIRSTTGSGSRSRRARRGGRPRPDHVRLRSRLPWARDLPPPRGAHAYDVAPRRRHGRGDLPRPARRRTVRPRGPLDGRLRGVRVPQAARSARTRPAPWASLFSIRRPPRTTTRAAQSARKPSRPSARTGSRRHSPRCCRSCSRERSKGTPAEETARAMILETPPETAMADLAGLAVRDEGFEVAVRLGEAASRRRRRRGRHRAAVRRRSDDGRRGPRLVGEPRDGARGGAPRPAREPRRGREGRRGASAERAISPTPR